MRALRVVGLTEGGDVVLEDPVRLERYTVPADERLRAAARGDLSRLGQIAIELESQLRPREIQARIRAGASVEQVAAAAGVPEQKIERFAYPVLLERFRTADNAQRAHPVRSDGPDSRTLAEVVAHTFGLRGQAYEGARWDSWKGEDGRWVVSLSWRAGRSDNRAHWTFQPGAHGGLVTALDENASDLVEGLPARPLRTVGAVVDMARPEEEEPPPTPAPAEQWRAAASDGYHERMPLGSESARPERGTATRTAPDPWRPAPPAQRQAEPAPWQRAEARDGGVQVVETPPAGTSATAAPARAETAPAASADARDPGSTDAANAAPSTPDPVAAPTAASDTVTPDTSTSDTSTPDTSTPDTNTPDTNTPDTSTPDTSTPDTNTPDTSTPDTGTPDATAPAGSTRRSKKGKPVMPSWDEVLLGVRGPR
jgi:Protein of unknown function (DUF3071)